MERVTEGTLSCASAVRVIRGEAAIVAPLAEELRAALGGLSPDICLMFASAHLEGEAADLALELHEQLSPRTLIGATGESVIAGEVEYENQAAISVFAARLPRTHVRSFHISQADLERDPEPADIADLLGIPADAAPTFLLMGDPFSIDPLHVLAALEKTWPGCRAIGGMASGAEKPRQNAVIFDGQTLRQGMTGIALWGGVRIDSLVSQGCRPIGRHMVITKAERNVIVTLGGRPPLTVVREMLNEAPARDQQLARERGLLIGCAINEYKSTFGRGDFLIRNPIRFYAESGALEVNDMLRVGQTVQFHVRDSESAEEDLRTLLTSAKPGDVAGALLFSCNGRGTRLFPVRSHDARMVADLSGAPPIAGMFCAGEIGPIGARNFLHGHTASIALIRRPERA